MTTGVVIRRDRQRTRQSTVRPKVLFLACYFPPVRSSASVRTWNIAKYLARLGWKVTVVTPDPSLWRHVDDPKNVSMELDREGIQRIMTGHRWSCLSPDHLRCWNKGVGWVIGGVCRRVARQFGIDMGIGWIQEASRSCDELTSDHVDVVLTTGDPFASFPLAKRLSEKLKCGYILDYRDAWTLPSHGRLAAAILKQETELIESSCAVTTVSRSLLNGRFVCEKKVHVITNGFDPEEMARVIPYEFGHPAIVYAGTFYSPKRVVTPLMAALKRLQETEHCVPWRFHYYGPNEEHVRQEARRFGVTEQVILHGRVTRREALSALKGAQVSIVITSVLEEGDPEDRGIVTGKIFDSIGLKVPILVIGPAGSDVEEILGTSGLGRLVTANNIDGMLAFLKEAISADTSEAGYPELYAWPNIIKRLDIILKNAVASYRPPNGIRGNG